MRYEPMQYIYEYEIGAFAIFLVIMIRYFVMRRFPSQKSRMYSLILWLTVLDIVLDVSSSHAIQYVSNLPAHLTYIINTSFYGVTVLMLVLMMMYAIALVKHINKKRLKRLFPLLIPGIVTMLLLLTNPFTKLFFYVDPAAGYVHGDLFVCIYLTSFIYLVFTFIFTYKNRLRLRRQEYTTIVAFLTVVLAATIVQYFIPSLMITGIAIMFAVGFMYFTIQNPESMMDKTTGAFTYDAMITFLQNCKEEQVYVQIVAIKIHNMARINALLGIENGSVLLNRISSFMRANGQSAWVFRMRGSSFVAITCDKQEYEILNARVREGIGQAWKIGNTDVLLQASVYCMETDTLFDRPIAPETAVKLLETTFLRKKPSGERIRTITVDANLIKMNDRRHAVEFALRDALSTGVGLELYFQPLWSVTAQRFTRAEVLLRFKHVLLGNIAPDEFIEIAESCGFITELDEWVVRQTCALIKKHGFSEIGIEHLEINLSALEFMHQRLPELLHDIMQEYAVDPAFLCFEITETATTESFELLDACMQKMCNLGCSFALDDFGTGYANISKVLGLPFSLIKLDKSLLYHAGEVIKDMSSMFSHMERQVVVEGVETTEQAQRCKECQAEYIQGFYYAKPMNQQAFIEFMKKQACITV